MSGWEPERGSNDERLGARACEDEIAGRKTRDGEGRRLDEKARAGQDPGYHAPSRGQDMDAVSQPQSIEEEGFFEIVGVHAPQGWVRAS